MKILSLLWRTIELAEFKICLSCTEMPFVKALNMSFITFLLPIILQNKFVMYCLFY